MEEGEDYSSDDGELICSECEKKLVYGRDEQACDWCEEFYCQVCAMKGLDVTDDEWLCGDCLADYTGTENRGLIH